ncbi:Prophage CP4-57 integrase [Variovorax sp. SRS16]|uniref:tyrosine-type recombinase/integrase n=1 Tax=Variovorax sp. SRS16 TaxID=282217 RepID=UPI001316ED0B|nr:site-specific integrase [Variovorax sp. SRS16]VTU16562.1 Prophage CP4-57 integrase [Variovorax sp. SRS16]
MAKLTVKAIESARPKAAPYKLTVDTGLYIRVSTSGEKRWVVKYVLDGKQREARLPKPYGANGAGVMSLADAVTENQRVQSLARAGIDFQEQATEALAQARAEAEQRRLAAEKERAALLPFTAMFNEWLDAGVKRKDGNDEIRRAFGKDVLPAIGGKPVKHITDADLRGALAAIVDRKRNRMAVRVYRDLVQLFGWAEKRQPWRALLIEQNPAALLNIETIVSKDYNLDDTRKRRLSPAELRELDGILRAMAIAFGGAENKRKRQGARGLQPMSQAALWLCLSTMCRIGELLQARWEHVDLATGVWRIPEANTKQTNAAQDDHIVFLSPFALRQFESLRRITSDSPWCFPSRNRPVNDEDREGAHVDVKSVSKQVGDRQTMFKERSKPLKNRTNDDTLVLSKGTTGEWTPHDLRRTGATMMQKAGVNPDVVDRCLNHVLPGGSKARPSYLQHDYAPEKRAAWEVLGREIEAILSDAKTAQ